MQTFLMFLENCEETPEIHGEYWIEENGQVLGADDASDLNHEGHVIQLMQSMVADKAGINSEDWEEVKMEIANTTYNETIQELNKARDKAESHEDHEKLRSIEQEIEKAESMWDDEDYLPFLQKGLKDHDVSDEEYKVAEGIGDTRDYAMEHWGWKRVDDHNIETWNFTPKDIDTILTGVYEIAQEENIGQLELYIYVHSNGTSHEFTFEQLEEMLHPKQVTPATNANYSLKDPTLQTKQIARDRYNADINRQDQAAKNYPTDQDLDYMKPYYANKKFPFADWTFRNHGIIL